MHFIRVYWFALNLIISPLFTVSDSSMKIERFSRTESFATIDEALSYVGSDPGRYRTQNLVECAHVCLTKTCSVFLYHRSTKFCWLFLGEFHNSSSSHNIATQSERKSYSLYQYNKEAVDCPTCLVSLGMESRDIPDTAISVSEEYISNKLTKNNSRIRAKGGWSTPHIQGLTIHNYWISIALNGPAYVYQIGTSGCSFCIGKWVEQYSVEFSDDGVNWTTYKDNGTKKIFIGNSLENANGIVYNYFNPPLITSHFKLYTEKLSMRELGGVLTAVGGLRMDLYGLYI